MPFENPAYTLYMTFGENLKKLRKARKISQVDLAQRLGMTQPVIAHYEKGLRKPDVEKLRQIAEALDVDVGNLFDEQKGNIKGTLNTKALHHNSRAAKVQEIFGKLPEKAQENVYQLMKTLASQGGV